MPGRQCDCTFKRLQRLCRFTQGNEARTQQREEVRIIGRHHEGFPAGHGRTGGIARTKLLEGSTKGRGGGAGGHGAIPDGSAAF
jgi:hypothetical protein